MLVIDSHLDIAWNALQWNRDMERSAHTIRTNEGRLTDPGRGQGTVGFPELRSGGFALSFVTLLARSTGHAVPHIDYASPHQAYAAAQGQLAYYRALEKDGVARVITDAEGLNQHMTEWEDWDDEGNDLLAEQPPLGFVISMEGVDPILTSDELEEWWAAGVRLIGLSHYGPGRYAGGTSTENGLSEFGIAILPQMERLGIPLDLTHTSDQAFWQALEGYDGPVLASHNNCRALVPHQRQFSDAQLRAIIQRGGVIGAAFDNWMLKPGWIIGESDPRDVTLEDVADHIAHVCELAGNARHAAIGTDLDGGFGKEQSPSDLDTIADVHKLAFILERRGYSVDDIEAIFHGNWLRFLREAWGSTD